MYMTRKDCTIHKVTDTSVICSAHFRAPDDFLAYDMWKNGFKTKLELVKGAIPSIRPAKVQSTSAAGRASTDTDDRSTSAADLSARAEPGTRPRSTDTTVKHGRVYKPSKIPTRSRALGKLTVARVS